MFLFRLKHQFQEHKLTSLIWLGTLLLLLLTTYFQWNTPLEFDDQGSSISFVFTFLGAAVASVVHINQVLGRDLYLQHTAFWNTRPIRGKTLFKVKWTYLQLSITLPIMITVALLAMIIRRPDQLLRGALEYGAISLMVTSAFTYSMLAIRSGRYHALFLFGATLFIPMIMIVSIFPQFSQARQDLIHQVNGTPLLILSFLTLGFIALFLFTLRKRHSAPSLLFVPIMALITLCLIIFQPLTWTNDKLTKVATIQSEPVSEKIYWGSSYVGEQDRLTFRQNFSLGESEWDASQRSNISAVNLRLLEIPENLANRIVITAQHQSGVGPRIQINCSFCSDVSTGPKRRSGSSSLEKSHPVHALSADTPVTISGTILVSQNRYRELVNPPIESDETQSVGSLRHRIRKGSPRSGEDLKMKLQYGNLATLVSPSANHFSEFKINLTHPPTGLEFDRGSGSSSGGPLGVVQQSDFNLRSHHETKESGFTKQQIIDQAVLKISTPDDKVYYEIPVEFKTMIPDPAKVLELLD